MLAMLAQLRVFDWLFYADNFQSNTCKEQEEIENLIVVQCVRDGKLLLSGIRR